MSLRARLTLIAAVLVIASLAVFSVFTTARLRSSLRERTDRELSIIATAMSPFANRQLIRIGRGQAVLTYSRLPIQRQPDGLIAFAVVIPRHREPILLPDLTAGHSRPRIPNDASARVGRAPFRVAQSHAWIGRVVAMLQQDAVLFVAVDQTQAEEAVNDLIRVEFAGGAVILLFFVLVAIVGVRAGLRPLDEIAAVADDVAAGRFSRRTRARRPNTEIGRLSGSVNTMLEKLETGIATRESARARTERFAADIAHELRTPITAIAGYAQLAGQGGVTGEARTREVFARIEHEAARLRELTENLLELDRIERGVDAESEVVDVGELCRAAAADSMTIAPNHTVELEFVGGADPEWRGRRNDLFQIVANLLANVRAHTGPGTIATVRVRDDPGWLVIEVADNGPGIAPADRERVFQRFTRLGVGDVVGSGLGLAIVRALAERTGGTAEIVGDSGTRVRVCIPTAVSGDV